MITVQDVLIEQRAAMKYHGVDRPDLICFMDIETLNALRRECSSYNEYIYVFDDIDSMPKSLRGSPIVIIFSNETVKCMFCPKPTQGIEYHG